jgi:hypothetical protein
MANNAITPMAQNFGQSGGSNMAAGATTLGANLLSGLFKGAGGGPTVSKLVDMSSIDVAPVGVNLGEILKPYQEGSPQNGGYGISIPSQYLPDNTAKDQKSIQNDTVPVPAKTMEQIEGKFPIVPIAIGAGGLILAIFLFKGRG